MIADRRLYLDRSQTRLVAGTSPDCAWLLVAKGHEIPAEAVKRLGLVKHEGRVMQASQVPAPKAPEPAEESIAYGDMAAQGVSPAPAMEPASEPIMPPQAKRTWKRKK